MALQNNRIDFGNAKTPSSPFQLFEYIISDRGSQYSVSIGHVTGRDDIKSFLKQLKSKKQYQKADHNSWAARLSHESVIYETKNDDGETGAGMVILRLMQAADVTNCIVCVTRWFGGIKLMGARFKHIQDATRHALNNMQ